MKKFTKVILILCAVFFVLGIGFGVAGLCMGYVPGTFFNNMSQQMNAVENDAVTMEYDQKFSNVKKLKLSVGMASVRLETWNGKQIQVEAVLANDMKCRQQGDELTIQYGEDNHSLLNLVGQNTVEIIRIRVPKDLQLSKLEIQGGAAVLEAEGITCQELDLEGGAGSYGFSGTVTDQISANCGMGEVRLTLNGSVEDYAYDMDCGLGSIIVEGGPSIQGVGDHKANQQAKQKMKLECGLGSIQVAFQSQV